MKISNALQCNFENVMKCSWKIYRLLKWEYNFIKFVGPNCKWVLFTFVKNDSAKLVQHTCAVWISYLTQLFLDKTSKQDLLSNICQCAPANMWFMKNFAVRVSLCEMFLDKASRSCGIKDERSSGFKLFLKAESFSMPLCFHHYFF